jgi:predicted regulator of Ras-like GTPase activity (Roadblock/LC7/MglB family)
MNDLTGTDPLGPSRSYRLDRVIQDLLATTPEIEAVAVVSFDGLPMASALPSGMDEDRVAAMSAALLSLGDRAAEGLGRGELSQVYIEGDAGTVFLVSAEDEAVLVAVAAKGAKAGLMLYEVRRTAAAVADVLRPAPVSAPVSAPPPAAAAPVSVPEPAAEPAVGFGAHAAPAPSYTAPEPVVPTQSAPFGLHGSASASPPAWASSVAVHGTVMPGMPTAPTWT